MKKVVILGAGGHAHVIADIVAASGDKVVAFLDDDLNAADRCGTIKDYEKYSDAEFIIGIGNATIREKLASRINVKWYTAIHPTAVVSLSATIKEGTVIMPNAVINARSSIGKHCIINTSSVVEHDNVIENYVHVSVGARLGGNVVIGKKTLIGIGATIRNGIVICADCIIGAGAVVVKNIEESSTYIGMPAKELIRGGVTLNSFDSRVSIRRRAA